ncbi:MAG: agmatinase [Acidobacteriota bacterium]
MAGGEIPIKRPNYLRGEPVTFAGLDPEEYPYDRSAVAVLPIPYEATTSFMAGTRNGPRELIQASRHLEVYDEELDAEVYRVGIHTLPDLQTLSSSPEEMVGEIYRATKGILDDGKFLVALGGEHTITPPLVKAHLEKHPGLCVLQIDAHGDLRDTYQGSRYSHACAMRRVVEMTQGVQVGIRSISAEEVEVLSSLPTRLFYAFETRQDPHWHRRAVEALGNPVYVTIDLDGLDPSIMPAVGTPEPGGLSWHEVSALLRELTGQRRVVGFDVNELAPIPGLGAPNFLAAKLVYKFLGYIFAERLKKASS